MTTRDTSGGIFSVSLIHGSSFQLPSWGLDLVADGFICVNPLVTTRDTNGENLKNLPCVSDPWIFISVA